MRDARCIGPMQPWCCTMWIQGKPFGITLYATDPDQIERDNRGIRVDGRLIAESDT